MNGNSNKWRLVDRTHLKELLKERGLVVELPEGATPPNNESPVGVGTIVTFLDRVRPEWYFNIPEQQRRRLISYTMHDLGYVGHTRTTKGGRISSWVHRVTSREYVEA